jgi:Ca2+-binding RTX toxin-like protein
MTETRIFANYATDLNGNGIVEGNGYMLPVEGEFPLQVGDTVRIYSRQFVYLGTDGDGGGIFGDLFDAGEVYGSDVVRLGDGDPFPDPLAEELPLNGEDPGQEPPNVPVISIAPADATPLEGDEGTTEYTFTVTRAGDELLGTSSVQVALVPGDTDADDFGGTLPETQTVTFAPGETEKTVAITGSGDIDHELDEAFEVSLEFATDATIDETASSAVGTITNDDKDEVPATVIIGTAGDDTITPTEVSDGVTGGRPSAADDVISALAGNDTVDGGGGDDTIFGGTGDDTLQGGDGNDTLLGGLGNDRLLGDDIDGGEGNDLLLGGEGNDFLEGGTGDDVLVGGDNADLLDGANGNDALFGGSGWDILYGGLDGDYLNGGDDTDFLFGDNGDDVIEGGAGNDLLVGDDGMDVLDGGDGDDRLEAGNDNDNDTLTGGAGSDTFDFSGENGVDTITDFTDGEDIIDLARDEYNVDDVNDFDIEQDGENVVISGYLGMDTFFDNTIVVENAEVADFTNEDFLFG